MLLHCEVPLYRNKNVLKEIVTGIIKNDNNHANTNRARFNNLLNKKFQGNILEIAKMEYVDINGNIEYDYSGIETLANMYTDDGGHLNSIGRLIVSRKFVEQLAAIIKNQTKSIEN